MRSTDQWRIDIDSLSSAVCSHNLIQFVFDSTLRISTSEAKSYLLVFLLAYQASGVCLRQEASPQGKAL
jgi:hypothetical protein